MMMGGTASQDGNLAQLSTNNLIGVLTRFRKHSVAVVGDIRAMFHSVMVDPCDRSALRFFWWEDNDMSRPPTAYQLTVRCFGLTSSPSVARAKLLKKTAQIQRPKLFKQLSEICMWTTCSSQFLIVIARSHI